MTVFDQLVLSYTCEQITELCLGLRRTRTGCPWTTRMDPTFGSGVHTGERVTDLDTHRYPIGVNRGERVDVAADE